jgi:hypothetical protein
MPALRGHEGEMMIGTERRDAGLANTRSRALAPGGPTLVFGLVGRAARDPDVAEEMTP